MDRPGDQLRRVRRAWPVLLWLSLLPFAGWTVVRLFGIERGAPWMQLMSFTPYVAAAATVPPIVAALTRHWWHAGVAAVLTAVLVGLMVPRVVADSAPASVTGQDGIPVRVITANLMVGQADITTLVRIVREHDADVLAVQELTPAAAARLDAAGLSTLLPHRSLHPVPGPGGSAVFSRYPLRDTGARRMPAGNLQAFGRLLIPGARPVLVESAHPCSPFDARETRRWTREMTLQPRATPAGPVRILLGDFNSTLDHKRLRQLVGSGYTDAAEAAGAGLRPTWFGLVARFVPPVVIDHVLVDRRIGVGAFAVRPLPGSDHRAVYADLTIPR
jgi:endonuclease/exonuclease/phosphatase (EEP) superfamily protein YafD